MNYQSIYKILENNILYKQLLQIYCLIIRSKSEDLNINCSYDKTIKFWYLCSTSTQLFWSCLQTIATKEQINGLSLNPEGNKLISCGLNNKTQIIEEIDKFKWQIKQISLTIEILYFNQPGDLKNVYIQHKTKQFIKSKQIVIQGGSQTCQQRFPQIYNDSKQILISKNGYNVNISSFFFNTSSFSNIDCKLEQSINQNSDSDGFVVGTLSQNGKYLITWDKDSNQLLIRQFIEQKQILYYSKQQQFFQ
ncbi:unnamed protein product [Paramecium sonneborni]|uniref:Uncharacterized protein n=1 Tax=Paramecium sonneborni TaxID=65129 RepID=A0A8S1N9Z2_9CILI|nr:unnamed protein product [Paramecium sonneborni]CAD8085817.1 unnamed protein product [Paramecium sonneborni]